MKEIVVMGGKNKDIEVKIIVEETEMEKYGKKCKFFTILEEVNGVKENLKLQYFPRKNYYTIHFYNTKNNLFGRKGDIYITISEEDWKKLAELEEEIRKKNEELYQQFLKSIPLKFIVRKENLRLLDMYYTAKVFIPNREMTKEEKERYEKLKKAVEKFNRNKWHLDGYIDAEVYKEEQEFTFEQLEEMFREEIEQYENYLKEIEERKRKKQEEYERKKKEALEEAKRTGKEVIIRKVGMFDGDDPANEELLKAYGLGGYDEGNEYGIVIVWEVATPDGKVVEKATPCY